MKKAILIFTTLITTTLLADRHCQLVKPSHDVIENPSNIRVSLKAKRDAVNGFNLVIVPRISRYAINFFTPNNINCKPNHYVNTGHGHLYINGKKITRVYSNYFYIPGYMLKEGKNLIHVQLNSDNHRPIHAASADLVINNISRGSGHGHDRH